MELYTVQLYKKGLAESYGVPVLDTTVKSGDIVFQPTWEMVLRYKGSSRSKAAEERYTKEYEAMMKASRVVHLDRWVEVLHYPKIALACYCPAGKFCHRHLLAEMFEDLGFELGIEVEFKGEIDDDY